MLTVGVGGWIAMTWLDGGLAALALVAGAGLVAYGSTLVLAFRAGAWRPVSAPSAASGNG